MGCYTMEFSLEWPKTFNKLVQPPPVIHLVKSSLSVLEGRENAIRSCSHVSKWIHHRGRSLTVITVCVTSRRQLQAALESMGKACLDCYHRRAMAYS